MAENKSNKPNENNNKKPDTSNKDNNKTPNNNTTSNRYNTTAETIKTQQINIAAETIAIDKLSKEILKYNENYKSEETDKSKNTKDKEDNKNNEKNEKTQKAIDKENKSINDLLRDIKKDREDSKRLGVNKDDFFFGFLIILSILAYVLDTNALSGILGGGGGFVRDTTTYLWPPAHIFAIYMLIIILGIVFVFKDEYSRKNFLTATLASSTIIPAIIHWLIYIFETQEWIITLLGIAALFPVLPLYLISQLPEKSGWNFFKWLAKFWVTIWLISGIFFMITNPFFLEQTKYVKGTIITPVDAAGRVIKSTIDSIGKGFNNIIKSYDRMVKQATGQPYESTDEERRGIIIEKVMPVEKEYYTSSDVYVQAKIKAQNIIGEVYVKTSCYIKDKNKGTTIPEIIQFINNDENIIDCHLGKLPKGLHQVIVAGTFVFTTDADIQYYFIDENARPELYKELNIPEKTVAISSGGPVDVGLPSLSQPLRISTNKPYVGNYPFGISLNNKWTQGKVNRGLNYTLEVPQGIELVNCTRKISGTFKTKEDRTVYVFESNTENIKETFDSVSCRMKIYPEQILKGDVVAVKTFNARAVYEYTVESNTLISIKEG